MDHTVVLSYETGHVLPPIMLADLSYKRAYKNGINGMVVHKTDRASLVGNVIWDNGQVSRDRMITSAK